MVSASIMYAQDFSRNILRGLSPKKAHTDALNAVKHFHGEEGVDNVLFCAGIKAEIKTQTLFKGEKRDVVVYWGEFCNYIPIAR